MLDHLADQLDRLLDEIPDHPGKVGRVADIVPGPFHDHRNQNTQSAGVSALPYCRRHNFRLQPVIHGSYGKIDLALAGEAKQWGFHRQVIIGKDALCNTVGVAKFLEIRLLRFAGAGIKERGRDITHHGGMIDAAYGAVEKFYFARAG